MKLALVSDIHANLQAWEAVLADIKQNGADEIICLGDIVGYGPRPAECLESALEHCDAFVIGNHDAVVAGVFSDEKFNPDARRMIHWTKDQLNDEHRAAFRDQEYSLVFDVGGYEVACTHATYHSPELFHYIIKEQHARKSWAVDDVPIIFLGHTHLPVVDVLGADDTYERLPSKAFTMQRDKRYIVNVGSVGMPRDKDYRACYCLFDTVKRRIVWRRVDYDVEALRTDVESLVSDSAQARRLLSAVKQQAQTGAVKSYTVGDDDDDEFMSDFDPLAKLAEATKKKAQEKQGTVSPSDRIQDRERRREEKSKKQKMLGLWAGAACLGVFGGVGAGLLAGDAPSPRSRQATTQPPVHKADKASPATPEASNANAVAAAQHVGVDGIVPGGTGVAVGAQGTPGGAAATDLAGGIEVVETEQVGFDPVALTHDGAAATVARATVETLVAEDNAVPTAALPVVPGEGAPEMADPANPRGRLAAINAAETAGKEKTDLGYYDPAGGGLTPGEENKPEQAEPVTTATRVGPDEADTTEPDEPTPTATITPPKPEPSKTKQKTSTKKSKPLLVDLVGFWRFEDRDGLKVTDNFSKAHHGALSGKSFGMKQSGTTGKRGKALTFDGKDDLVTVIHDEALSPEILSLTLWMRPSPSRKKTVLIQKTDKGFPNKGYTVGTKGGFLSVQLGGARLQKTLRGKTKYPKDEWVHVALLYNGERLQVFENGVMVMDESVKVGPLPITKSDLLIGKDFRGALDEIRLYKRIITEDEIKAIMALNK